MKIFYLPMTTKQLVQIVEKVYHNSQDYEGVEQCLFNDYFGDNQKILREKF